jgi:hypothetical protein
VGKRIANEIVSVYEEIEELKDEAVFKHKVIKLDLPLRKVTIAEYEKAVRELEYYVEKNKNKERYDFEDNAKMHVHAGVIQRYREQQYTELYPIEYHVVRLGDIAIATNPFELFLDYGNRMKARSYAEQTFIVQLCCGSGFYLPTEKAEKAGHYWFDMLDINKINIGTSKLQLVKNGIYVNKYKITIPKELNDYE